MVDEHMHPILVGTSCGLLQLLVVARVVQGIVSRASVWRSVDSLLVDLGSLMCGNAGRGIFRCASLLELLLRKCLSMVRSCTTLHLLLYPDRLLLHLLHWPRLLRDGPEVLRGSGLWSWVLQLWIGWLCADSLTK